MAPGGPNAWWAGVGRSRPHRVVLLAAVIVLLSAADLYLTILYASSMGMAELNPLARAVMSSGSPTDLAVWKLMTVGLCVGVLCWARRARSAELGAWVGALVLIGLTCRWGAYAEETERIVVAAGQVGWDPVDPGDPRWVQLGGARND